MCAAMVPPKPRLNSPTFVVATARSGSTLLRQLLDAHPQVVAPPESDLAYAVDSIMEMWTREKERASESQRRREGLAQVRSVVRRYASYHCKRTGKEVFCDKSLATAFKSEGLIEAFPEARFITLHRHAMDVVASGIDASRWGFYGYGFSQYIKPDNFVSGMVEYWCTVTAQTLALEQRLGSRCLQVQYERLALDTDVVLKEICEFLDVEWHPSIVADSFAREAHGPGDYKVGSTQGPHADSIGWGIEVPVQQISPQLREIMNCSLALLGYPEVSAEWNFQPSPLRTRLLSGASDGKAVRGLARTIRKHLGSAGDVSITRVGEAEVGEVTLILEENGKVHSWLIDFKNRALIVGGELPGTGTTIYASIDAITRVAAGHANPGALHYRNEIRVRGASGSESRQALAQLQRVLCGPPG